MRPKGSFKPLVRLKAIRKDKERSEDGNLGG